TPRRLHEALHPAPSGWLRGDRARLESSRAAGRVAERPSAGSDARLGRRAGRGYVQPRPHHGQAEETQDPMQPSARMLEADDRANELYWGSNRSVNQIAEDLDLSKGALYGMIRPLPAAMGCPACG